MLPLEGIKVIEMTHMVMGPVTGVILADLGAEVIKIEPIGGDKTRRLKGSGAGYFAMYNRNKQSICIDLKNSKGQAIAYRLIDGADVFIENFRTGSMANMGFGSEHLRTRNPKLIYCSLKGFLSGPYSHRTALDEVAQMMGGLAYMTGPPGQPLRAGASIIDVTGGMFGVIAILAALQRRHASNVGEHVESSLFETTAFLVGQHMAQEQVTGEPAPPMTVRQSAWSIYEIFESAEGNQIFVAVVSDALWQRFCAEFDLSDFAADKSLDSNEGRVNQRERIIPAITALFQSLTTKEMVNRLESAGIPFAPINRPTDLFSDPHLRASDGLLDVSLAAIGQGGRTAQLPALPVEYSAEKFKLRKDLPEPGEDSVQVLQDAGLSADEIEELRAQTIVA
ncbi:MAG: CoA transferase [Gammaproteobacteria bacterium]|nr:CoA transferase [Gammaproteobacteria bacterium]